MRAIMVMFDSLNRRLLPNFGADEIEAPNFERLARMSVTFDNCYAGSMPCMPARRELHTGRYNFLHRSWGPLEPFDDSMPEILKNKGVHTHLATDHQHYWEDGGATYHARYSTFEFFRGQEGDPWKAHVGGVTPPPNSNGDNFLTRQDWVNRLYLTDEADHPQTLTFDAGLGFLETNVDKQDWFLQVETFDPHEPFFSYERYRELYPERNDERIYDWPSYRRVIEDDATVDAVRAEYFALVSMCDRSLGRVLDFMDEHDMWDDTMLIVNTDHGFLLGEHGWWGKSVMPWFDESIHTPLFLWDPRVREKDARRSSLVATIDIAPTLLDFFGIAPTPDMQGRPLQSVVTDDTPVRDATLFGVHGSHVSITDGRYVYMRACATDDNRPLFEYTLMPTHMRSRFFVEELRDLELAEPFAFTKGVKTLKIPAGPAGDPAAYGTLLYDLVEDPDQRNPLRDPALERRMAELLVVALRESDAPSDQFERLGLPAQGPVTSEHLLVERQWDRVLASSSPAPLMSDFPRGSHVVTTPIGRLLEDDRTRGLIHEAFPSTRNDSFGRYFSGMTPIMLTAAMPQIKKERLDELEAALVAAIGTALTPTDETIPAH
ncbi:sulfatase [Microbacterium sp. NPDC019599]|uniref:sulfatase n=1 Tax=Microbacterium sp. NPDC019599 TaxID=3154690 RepID=UPI0033DC165C